MGETTQYSEAKNMLRSLMDVSPKSETLVLGSIDMDRKGCSGSRIASAIYSYIGIAIVGTGLQ